MIEIAMAVLKLARLLDVSPQLLWKEIKYMANDAGDSAIK